MRVRNSNSFSSLPEILDHLGSPDRTGLASTWVGKDYSLKQLILDLTDISDNNIPVWTTMDGYRIRVSHMSDDHVLNAMQWLLDDEGITVDDFCNGNSVGYWISIFGKELADRGIGDKIKYRKGVK